MPDCPHLGWDPAPGSPPAIAALRTRLTACATALATAHGSLDRLLGESAFWRGDAADAFRSALDGELPRFLRDAHRSVDSAARDLSRWHDDLLSRQATALRYDARARLHQEALTDARAHEHRLRAHPSTPAPDLHAAATAVTRALTALESVRHLARELDDDHHAQASLIAKRLNESASRLAPEEPGVLDKVLEWVEEDLGDLLSDVSAGAGFLALLVGTTCPPLGLALLFAATGASMGAFALHVTDSEVRQSLRNGLTKGERDAEFWDNAVTLTGDALGSVPGVAAIAHGAKAAASAIHASGAVTDTATLAAAVGAGSQGFTGGAKSIMHEMRSVENPLTGWALQSAPGAVKTAVSHGFPAAGAATAASHYTSWDDDEAFANGATGVDGARAVIDDGPGSAAKLARAWASLSR
ncbi:hypothetical protein [Streptomyces sp. NPDC020141]|uniref:hypothetical protein n=1 Tax=Streptomyces sp. NPDC020141 TaxID=3365065 RepID=UPI00378CAE36